MISIIVPLYNKAATIERCIKSVLAQTYDDWELLIIDDGSTDASSEIVDKYSGNEKIHYHYKKNGGVSSARNLGIKLAKGEWITYIDADDYFLPEALQILFELTFKMQTKISAANFLKENNGSRRKVCIGKKECVIKNNYKAWFFRFCFPRAGAALFHNSILKDHLFDESLSRYEDAKSLFDILRDNKVAYSPECVMVYSCDNNDLSCKSSDVLKDFTFSMDFENKSFWERVVLADLLEQGYHLYSEHKSMLRKQYSEFQYMLIMVKMFRLIKKFRIKLAMTKCV